MIVNIYEYGLDKTLSEVKRLATSYQFDCDFLKGKSLIEIFDYIKNIPYEPDPPETEFVMRPLRLMQRGKGDCDDKTVMTCAALLTNNIPCGFSIVSQSAKRNFHHIFSFIIKDNTKIDFDTTYPTNKPFVSKQWYKRQDYIL